MNKANYNTIADIINEFKHTPIELNETINKLADYFEKEDKEDLDGTEERFKKWKEMQEGFNRNQFLKKCGVDTKC